MEDFEILEKKNLKTEKLIQFNLGSLTITENKLGKEIT